MLSNVYIRKGRTRSGFTIVYNELWDCYHPLIGDKPTLYYTFLLRYRNTDEAGDAFGMAWIGRQGVVDRFRIGFATLPIIDDILIAAGLADVERRRLTNGTEKIYYTVHDPLESGEFLRKESEITARIAKVVAEKEAARRVVGKGAAF